MSLYVDKLSVESIGTKYEEKGNRWRKATNPLRAERIV